MRFGVFFELQLPRPWAEGAELALFQNALKWVEIADRVGIDYAWAQEHHFLEEYSHSTAPEVFLAAASQRTQRIRFGHGITLMPPPYNHPARVAERIATLDLVSNGRVEWGTGESSSRIELEGFGVAYGEKRAMWAEAVRECAKMMTAEPYPGHEGKYFSMPSRNVVPKPVQRPHPPLWVACTNRDTLRLAARLGVGALTFAFMDHTEAKFWVEEYYSTFKEGCTPLGQSVNPNVAMLGGLLCHRDSAVAREQGLEGQQFFKYGLAHYYRFGLHEPGRTNIWNEFQKSDKEVMAGLAGVGSPDEVREAYERLEATGLDQVILLQQAGRYTHDQICASLELFGSDVLPAFREREIARQAKKADDLAPYIANAMRAVVPPQQKTDLTVEAYPMLWGREASNAIATPRRSLDAHALWKMYVSGSSS
jgi:alkanesulfonate monooxygenase SsuD/methylene tetrahydromethanopterin reductase-like flavin-dependent oxidoreductase (luciferase family)